MITYNYSIRIFRFEILTEDRVVQYGTRDTLKEVHQECDFWLMRNNRTMKVWSEFVTSQCYDTEWQPVTTAQERALYAGTLTADGVTIRMSDKGYIRRR